MSSISQTNFPSIDVMTGRLLKNKNNEISRDTVKSSLSFREILEKQQVTETGGLKFSKHANDRLASRNIDLSQDQLERLENGAKKAQEKGIYESLVMVDDIAFIVNIKNKTVVTAVKDSDEKVFTNIDGAVIM
ncbi:MAG: Flagellar operon protein [Lachnoclostridium sp.]|jgi:flagellar operon protein